MDHRHVYKIKCSFAYVYALPRLYADKIPANAVIFKQSLFAFLGAVYFCVRAKLQQFGERARMVRLYMVYHYVLYPGGIRNPSDIVGELRKKFFAHGVYKGDFFINDKIRIIRYSFFCRIRASVKAPFSPVDASCRINVFFN